MLSRNAGKGNASEEPASAQNTQKLELAKNGKKHDQD